MYLSEVDNTGISAKKKYIFHETLKTSSPIVKHRVNS